MPKLGTARLREFVAQLAALDPDVDDAERIVQLGVLETLKASASAMQARVSVAFDASQRAAQREQGVAGERVGRGVAEQVALARRESPAQGARHLGLAKAWSASCRTPWPRWPAGR
jgi:hypothetical protein